MLKKLKNTRVTDLMQGNEFALKPEQTLTQALRAMAEADCTQALVMDGERLLGYIRTQDLLRGLWSCEFDADNQPTVDALMQTELTTVSAQESLGHLLESWVVDRDKLFPVNDMGSLICSGYLSYEERLRKAASPLPELLPVMERDRVLGVLSRQQVSNWVAAQLG
ncbi:CBS domain-containing protein [Shewanella sp. GXUN23E]|uniref:CBS domain-containing protein n=1 Tax=Shewanella sp. GXUN23E TaxID=3422498 RepID=UPI003D7EFE13